jgi:isopenicillin-N epimerase
LSRFATPRGNLLRGVASFLIAIDPQRATGGRVNPHRIHWQLDPEIRFLNHGSFGATPTCVLRKQQEYRDRLEREPVRFYVRDLPARLDAARERLARFVGADPAGFAFVRNATEAVNSVLRSMPLAPGDELLVTDHEYNACRNVLDYVARERGATMIVVHIALPVRAAEDIVTAITAAVTPKTRLLLIDHVTSPTGMVLPIAEIVTALKSRGVETLVDGAHAVGMLPLDLDRLGVAYYTSNFHKWLCAPKGSAFLYVRADKRGEVRPAVISHGANADTAQRSRYRLEFDWPGTVDVTPWLATVDALDFLERVLPGGIAEVREHNRALALEARALLLDAIGSEPLCPDAMIGHLATVRIADRSDAGVQGAFDTDPLQDTLLFEHRIEVPVFPFPRAPQRMCRVSAQLYNERREYQALAAVLAK